MKKSEQLFTRLKDRVSEVNWRKRWIGITFSAVALLILFAPASVPLTPFAVHDDDDGDGLFNEDGDFDGRDDDNDGAIDEEAGPGTNDVIHDNSDSGIDLGSNEYNIEENVTTFVDWLQENFRVQTQSIKENVTLLIEGENQPRSEPEIIDGLEEFLLADQVRTFFLLILMSLYAGTVRSKKEMGLTSTKKALKHPKTYGFVVFTALGFMLIDNMLLWEATMESLALVIGAAGASIIIGIPVGIMMAYSRAVDVFMRPTLDLMQTMPAFVYLIPAIVLFSTGVVSAMLATVIFAVPPLIRLTAHGIKGVDPELVEAGKAFGAGPLTRLMKIELPMAKPTIFVGINQMIMLSLSMIVIAALIGAEGLGNEIMRSINRINPGAGFEAGLAIVIVAIYLDRFVGAFGAEIS